MSASTHAAVGQCSICLLDIVPNATQAGEKSRKLNCSHVFHQLCIGEWMKVSHTCPLCRAAVDDDTPLTNRPSHDMSWEELIAFTSDRVREIRVLNLNENTQVARTARKVNSLAAFIFRQ